MGERKNNLHEFKSQLAPNEDVWLVSGEMALLSGVYRGLWRYISIDNVIGYGKAVVLSSLVSIIALVFAFRFEGLSRRVFALDAMIMFLLLTGSRAAFRLFRRMLPNGGASADGRRILIYGAGDAGELLLREVLNNRELQLTPVGFVDDDPLKKGKVIHGYRVFGGNGSLPRICQEQRVAEVVISSARLSDERLREIRRVCATAHVTLRRLRIQLEALEEE